MRRTLLTLLALIVTTPALAAEGPRWCSATVTRADAPEVEVVTPKSAAPTASARPLERVGVRWELELRGALATGTLVETFVNDSSAPVEAQYRVLAAPGFEVGATRIAIEGDERELERGKPSAESLKGTPRKRRPPSGLEMSKGFEVPTGAEVEIRVELIKQLAFQDGWFELELPVVTRDCRRAQEREKAPREEADVPLEVSLQIHHDSGRAEILSDTHPIADWDEPFGNGVELADPALVKEGPFVLRYRLESDREDEAELTGWVSEEREDGTRDLLVVLTPPTKAPAETIGETDAVFVLDTSGSMKGQKIASLRAGVADALELLDERDNFALISFASETGRYESSLVQGDGFERDSAKDWTAKLKADGNTKLLDALREAIAVASSGDHHPVVVVLTDGAIQDAAAVEKLLEDEGGSVRVLFVGIGAQPQADVLQRLAALARGEAAFAREASELSGVLSGLFGSFSSPLAWDLRLEAPGTEVVSTWPRRIPDLYEGRPVTLFVRVRGEMPETLRLRGGNVDGENGLDQSLHVAELPEARGLRGPRGLDGKGRGR